MPTQTKKPSNKSPSQANPRGFTIVNKFPLGYRNREDITNLPPGVLVVGSQNVLTNVSERIQCRKGYVIDGASSSSISSILSSYQWQTKGNGERQLRAGFLTSAANDGKLQYRFVDSDGDVTWTDIKSSLTTVDLNFTTWWDNTEQLRLMLWVDGSSNIYEWNGASTTLSSATATTLTKEGSSTWAAAGFYTTRNKSIVVGGVTATYTGGETTTTLTGVSVDFSAVAAGTEIHQLPITTANSAMTSISSTFNNGLIEVLNNQIYVGSLTNPKYYISKSTNYKDFSFSTPRVPTEGATATLDDNLVGFIPQEEKMYVTCGKDLWYETQFNKSADLTTENYDVKRLKSSPRQAAQSQALIAKVKNNVVFISNEPTLDELGRLANIFGTPQTNDISDPIRLDFDNYDFEDGSVFYHRNYIYVAVPQEGIIIIYNMVTKNWEAPQTIPVSRFYTVNGDLYGHSYSSSESYQLFTGYSDRYDTSTQIGSPIAAVAVFSYQDYNVRSALKTANELYVEGYITANTTLNIGVKYEIDGCATNQDFEIQGDDSQVVCLIRNDASLGKVSLGKNPLGSTINTSLTGLPPKFRAIPTFTRANFYEAQISFSIYGVDQRFELLAFGLNATQSTDNNVYIKQ